jgi:hypothetical protein
MRDHHGRGVVSRARGVQFESESLEAAGQALRRLQQDARAAGFELETGRVEPWEPDAPSGGSGTPYGPLDSEDAAED